MKSYERASPILKEMNRRYCMLTRPFGKISFAIIKRQLAEVKIHNCSGHNCLSSGHDCLSL